MQPGTVPVCRRTAARLALVLVAAGLAGADPAPAPAPVAAPPAVMLPPVAGQPPAAQPAPVFSVGDAVRWALEHNPDLATVRTQHGIAAAGVIISRTYPFNPTATSYVWYDNGPESAGVTNHVFNEHIVRLDLEIFHQGKHRRAAACAALSRTDWDIAAQEVALAVRVVRACDAFAYRREKLLLVDEGAKLLEESTERLGALVEQGRANRADLLLARADIADLRTARAPAYTQYVTAWYDLRRLLGLVDEPLDDVRDPLAATPRLDGTDLTAAALERRPDLHALELAVREAEARLRLEVSNRWGNPALGPAFEYNETGAYFIGAAIYYPLPVLNTHRGEIQLRRAEREKAAAALQAAEVRVRQDVQAALARLTNAEGVVEAFRTRRLPALQEAREVIDRLFARGEPGLDVARVTEVRRRQLQARDLYLDALFELTQARADLAAAVGDPALAMPPAPKP